MTWTTTYHHTTREIEARDDVAVPLTGWLSPGTSARKASVAVTIRAACALHLVPSGPSHPRRRSGQPGTSHLPNDPASDTFRLTTSRRHEMKRDADCSAFRPTEVHVPFIDWGTHQPSDGKACVMEAASWLAGEEWSDHPRSVHPVIARVARSVNDSLGVAERQRLWHLLLLSLDTARPYRPLLNWRLERLRRRTVARQLDGTGSSPVTWDRVRGRSARRCDDDRRFSRGQARRPRRAATGLSDVAVRAGRCRCR